MSVEKIKITIDVDSLQRAYYEWAKEKSTKGYTYGWHASHVFEFLKQYHEQAR